MFEKSIYEKASPEKKPVKEVQKNNPKKLGLIKVGLETQDLKKQA